MAAGYQVMYVEEDALPQGVGWAAVNDRGQPILFMKHSYAECERERVLAALDAHRLPRRLELE